MTLPAGQRSSLLRYERDASSVPGSTGTGEQAVSYEYRFSVWGRVAPVIRETAMSVNRAVNEAWAAYHMNANANWTITIPWTSGIETTGRFVEQGRSGTTYYNIAGPPMDVGGDLIIPVAEVV